MGRRVLPDCPEPESESDSESSRNKTDSWTTLASGVNQTSASAGHRGNRNYMNLFNERGGWYCKILFLIGPDEVDQSENQSFWGGMGWGGIIINHEINQSRWVV